MLAQAMVAPNVAVVLCSMLDEAHLRANLDAVEHPRFSVAEIAEFAARWRRRWPTRRPPRKPAYARRRIAGDVEFRHRFRR